MIRTDGTVQSPGSALEAVIKRRFTQVVVFAEQLTFGNSVAAIHDVDALTHLALPAPPLPSLSASE